MALIVRLSVYGPSGEHSIGDDFLEVVNVGVPPGYRPGAVDLRRYSLRLRDERAVRWSGTVDHLRSNGAWRLARLALDELDSAHRAQSDMDTLVEAAGFTLTAVTFSVQALNESGRSSSAQELEHALTALHGVPVQVLVQ